MPTRTRLPAALLSLLLSTAAARAAVTFIGEAAIDGQSADKSGLPATPLEDGYSPANALNGFGSGIAYAGGNTFYLLADRGPNKVAYPGGTAVDNTTSWQTRYQTFTLTFTPVPSSFTALGNPPYNLQYTNIATTLLTNPSGGPLLGLSTAFATTGRFDPESIRVAPNGTTWISDEYGPYLYNFNAQGKLINTLTVPASIINPAPAANASLESSAATGRVTNKGAEGLALSPDGKTLVVAMQGPLIQDGGGASTNNRLLVYDLTNPTAAPRQLLYQLDSKSMGISDILAVNNHQFLVDERDGTAGAGGKKLLYSIDLDQPAAPTDLATSAESGTTAANGLPATGTPADVTPLTKSLFANIGSLLTSAGNAFVTANGLPDKIEGYAWGPDLPDGRHLLLATNDNDFTQPGDPNYLPKYIFAFAVDPSDVPNFVAATYAPVPEPTSLAALTLGSLTLLRRRNNTR
jgi:hypothetical protein